MLTEQSGPDGAGGPGEPGSDGTDTRLQEASVGAQPSAAVPDPGAEAAPAGRTIDSGFDEHPDDPVDETSRGIDAEANPEANLEAESGQWAAGRSNLAEAGVPAPGTAASGVSQGAASEARPSDSNAPDASASEPDEPDVSARDVSAPDASAPDAPIATDGAEHRNAGEQNRNGGEQSSHPGEEGAPDTPTGDLAEAEEAEQISSSEEMALPLPEIVDDGPRDQVWGQDRPGAEGKNVTALSQLIESVTTPASRDGEQDSDTTAAPAATGAAGTPESPESPESPEDSKDPMDTGFEDDDPDQMEELPSDRPVPADAIRRASEALDAAVNAAPAVIGSASWGSEDESGALVDEDLTHFDGETEPEFEPEDTASDYSVRVTDPIPVQSLSAPDVSRETSGPVQMPNGTQQPTGGPHGGDDERRSALIATVPAVDDTTPVAAELAMDARRRIELQGRRFPRPPKTRIITVANQKGGVGKTTTTVNVAAGLALSGLNVLVIDNDPQGNASTALGIEHRAGTPSVYEVLVEGESLASTVQQCPDVPNLWGVPATIDLSGSEIELVSLVSRETRLRKAIDKYLNDRIAAGEERIDYVLIDCPPSLGLLTVNAFVAGREVFIPIQCEYYALEGLSQLLKTIDLIRSHLNPELRVSSILLTMYDGRTNLAQQVAGEVRSHFPAETFKTTIPRSVRISEAPSYGQTVMTYDATSTGALAYLQASRELAERGQGGSSPRRAMQAEPIGAQD
ncbi:hypothetical protein GCM10023198_39440 [Promicromonospora umidemergens]|uniref:AAA domain-containing protein n=1 Tax=Promicromonospora umidemergens TaxID=629679 RepID=A0ABP8XQN8_9MICO